MSLEAAFGIAMVLVAIIGVASFVKRRRGPERQAPPLPACQRRFQQALREQHNAAAINHRTSLRAS